MYMFFALTDNNNSKEGGVRYVEPEQFNVAMLRAATNNFSEENKLGEGGFGEVFKVHFHLYVYTTRSCSIIGICGQCLFQLTSSSFKKKNIAAVFVRVFFSPATGERGGTGR